jgi:hypothetical protein
MRRAGDRVGASEPRRRFLHYESTLLQLSLDARDSNSNRRPTWQVVHLPGNALHRAVVAVMPVQWAGASNGMSRFLIASIVRTSL